MFVTRPPIIIIFLSLLHLQKNHIHTQTLIISLTFLPSKTYGPMPATIGGELGTQNPSFSPMEKLVKTMWNKAFLQIFS